MAEKKVVEVKLLNTTDIRIGIQELENRINNHIKKGWEQIGPIATTTSGRVVAQMVKYEEVSTGMEQING